MAVRIEFCLLGPLAVRCDGTSVPVRRAKERALLAALLLNARRVVPAATLMEVLWGADPPPSATASLQSHMMRLRRSLGDSVRARISTRPGGYEIGVVAGELDVMRVEELLRSGQAAVRDRLWERVAELSGAALAEWRGEPLTDVSSELLALQEIPRLTEIRLQLWEMRAEAGLMLDRYPELITELHRLAAAQPLREHLRALLILALCRCGRQADAVACYQDIRQALADELGVEPGAELAGLHRRILAGDKTLAGNTALTVAEHAPYGTGTRPAIVPVPRQMPSAVRGFTGRQAELATLTGLLDQLSDETTGAVVISVIGGTAGVGKTALAVQWSHQVADRFPDGQLYINLRGFDPSGAQLAPADAIRAFLEALGVAADAVPAQADAQVGLYRSLLAGRRMLVVLDNARDAGQVRALLPGSAGCLALITSRSQLTGLAVSDGAHQLNLDVLSESEAHALLTARLGAGRAGREPTAVAELTELSARLPLALSIAAARATAHAGSSLAGLVSQLRDVRARLDVLDAGEPAASVRAAFSWSYRQLTTPAMRLFQYLGLHPGPDITAGAAASLAGLPEPETRSLLGELSRAFLLSEHVPYRYTFHDLLRIYAGEQARGQLTQADRLAGAYRMYDHYLHTGFAAAMLLNPSRTPVVLPPSQLLVQAEQLTTLAQAMTWFDTEYQVLRNVIAVAADLRSEASSDRHAWQIPWTLVNFSDRRGRWDELAALQRTALTAAERLADPAGQARAHLNIGAASIRMGRYDDALTHLRRALSLFTSTVDCACQGHTLLAIAEVFARQEKPLQVLESAERALELFRAIDQEAGQAFALNTVGLAHLKLGRDQDALTCCDRALEIHRRLGNPFGQAESWEFLGRARLRLGQHAAAIDCLQCSLGIVRELGDRYNQAWVLEHMGDAYHAAGDRDEAARAWRRSLMILEDLHHHDISRIQRKLTDSGPLPAEHRPPGPGRVEA